jgi:hypothetical protein
MPTVAIYSSDVALRRRLDRLLRTDQPFRVAGSAGDAAAFGLLLEHTPLTSRSPTRRTMCCPIGAGVSTKPRSLP